MTSGGIQASAGRHSTPTSRTRSLPRCSTRGRRQSRSTRSSVSPNSTHTIPYPPTSTPTPTHAHTLYTHTFRRAVRAAVLQTYESPTDLPSLTWWRERRGVGGVQAVAFAWTRVAKARRIVQGDFDETQIDSKYEREFSFCRAIASRFAPALRYFSQNNRG
jgi:hypothetical protein